MGLSGLLSEVFGTKVTSGSLSDFKVADLVRLIEFQKKTGVLHIGDHNDKVDIHFTAGRLTDVIWLTRPDEKKLASLLVRKKQLTREQVQDAVERQKQTGQKLGHVLVGLGMSREDELSGLIRMHLIEGLRHALQLTSGGYAFEKLPEATFKQGALNSESLSDIYNQAIVGQEEHLFLQEKIDASIVAAGTEDLFFLSSGRQPPKPAELLGSERMAFLLSYLKQRFDILVIDSPPIMLAGDALLLTPHVDGAVFVVKAGQANRDFIKKGVEQLRAAKANLLGVILNQVDIRNRSYYRGYYKYRSNYYQTDE
jgi:capsular exopolysaccharide synthesis family protein